MNMVEKVARAIHAKKRAPDDGKHWFHDNPEFCDLSRQLARAAIEAMREPTREMDDVGRDHNFSRYATPAWQAMIDAALNGKEE